MPLIFWREELLPVLRDCCGPAAPQVLEQALNRAGVRDSRMSPACMLRVVRRIEKTLPTDGRYADHVRRLKRCASGHLRPASEALPDWLPPAYGCLAETIGPAAERLVRRTRATMDHRYPIDTVGGCLAFLDQLRQTLPAEVDANALILDIKRKVLDPDIVVRPSAGPAAGARQTSTSAAVPVDTHGR